MYTKKNRVKLLSPFFYYEALAAVWFPRLENMFNNRERNLYTTPSRKKFSGERDCEVHSQRLRNDTQHTIFWKTCTFWRLVLHFLITVQYNTSTVWTTSLLNSRKYTKNRRNFVIKCKNSIFPLFRFPLGFSDHHRWSLQRRFLMGTITHSTYHAWLKWSNCRSCEQINTSP